MNVNVPIDYELDHIGIAVNSIAKGRQFYEQLGMQVTDEETVQSQQVKVAMLELGNQCRIELLESTSLEGPIAKFIAKKGTGIHHICIRVKEIEKQLEKLKQKGFKLINETPVSGAHNCKVAFIHPKSTGGVLLELSEPQP